MSLRHHFPGSPWQLIGGYKTTLKKRMSKGEDYLGTRQEDVYLICTPKPSHADSEYVKYVVKERNL